MAFHISLKMENNGRLNWRVWTSFPAKICATFLGGNSFCIIQAPRAIDSMPLFVEDLNRPRSPSMIDPSFSASFARMAAFSGLNGIPQWVYAALNLFCSPGSFPASCQSAPGCSCRPSIRTKSLILPPPTLGTLHPFSLQAQAATRPRLGGGIVTQAFCGRAASHQLLNSTPWGGHKHRSMWIPAGPSPGSSISPSSQNTLAATKPPAMRKGKMRLPGLPPKFSAPNLKTWLRAVELELMPGFWHLLQLSLWQHCKPWSPWWVAAPLCHLLSSYWVLSPQRLRSQSSLHPAWHNALPALPDLADIVLLQSSPIPQGLPSPWALENLPEGPALQGELLQDEAASASPLLRKVLPKELSLQTPAEVTQEGFAPTSNSEISQPLLHDRRSSSSPASGSSLHCQGP